MLFISGIVSVAIILLWSVNNGSVILQLCPGHQSKPIKVFKFQLMRDHFDDNGNPLPDELRLIKINIWFRSVSLDELLQLINDVKGDMSIVSERPLLMPYIDHYFPEQARRLDVRPGNTEWAKVNSHNAISW